MIVVIVIGTLILILVGFASCITVLCIVHKKRKERYMDPIKVQIRMIENAMNYQPHVQIIHVGAV